MTDRSSSSGRSRLPFLRQPRTQKRRGITVTVQEKLIKNKLGLLELASFLGNVSEACRVMGYSRDTFYRVKKAHETGGMGALMEASRRKPNLRNRVDPAVEDAVIELALEDPSLGQKRASNELRERGVFISAAGVRSVWLRHGLERFDKRLKALEAHVAAYSKINLPLPVDHTTPRPQPTTRRRPTTPPRRLPGPIPVP
ncbi:helix-turn-helix domain-containing protein [candidate division GN15 bacterium]|nr:helix-turn-helix domain-containing protein [candidate division GN15 bacterium]